ncbi:MAG: FHA domain-containing protein [Acidimicrobiales bacterium]
MERHNGVMIGGTCGAVARAGRLTLLVGDAEEELGPTSLMPADALRLADELAATGDWEFETVAAALQAFVIDHDPPGVAALLEGDEETMVFLFDRAEAIEFHEHEDPETSERVQRGVGRSGWTTELVSGPWIQLRLGLDPIVPWTSLRWGVAIGSSATVPVATAADALSTDEQPAALVDAEPVDSSLIDTGQPDVDPVDPVEADEAHPNEGIGAVAAATAPYAASSPRPDHAPHHDAPHPDEPHHGLDPDEVPTGENPATLDDELDPDPAAEGWDAPSPPPDQTPPEPIATTPEQPPTSFQDGPGGSRAATDRHSPVDDPTGRPLHDQLPTGATTTDHDQGHPDPSHGTATDSSTPADSSAPADEVSGQETMVVDPSQIGLTRIGEGAAHDQPPPPGPATNLDPPPPGGPGATPSPPPPRPGQPPVPPPAPSPDQPPPPAAASPSPPPTAAPMPVEGDVDLALPPPPTDGQTVAAFEASPPSPTPTANQRPAPPPGTPPAADQPPAPGSGRPPTSGDAAPPSADQPPAPGAGSAVDQPPVPPPDMPPPSPPVSAEQPPTPPAGTPSPGTPPPGTPPPSTQATAEQPPAPPPGTPPSADQPPAPRTGQPPVPPGLGRTLAPGPADSGSRPEPPPLGAPPGGQLDPPPPGPQQSPPPVSQGTPPLPPPPSGSPVDTSTPAPPEALAGEPPSAAGPVPGPTPPGPGAEALPPPAGSAPPPPRPGGGAPAPEAGPIVGYLIDADNETIVYPIAGHLVIGTDPDDDAEVVIGAATTITIDDPSVHDVHVRIKVNGHEVTAEDAGFGESWVQIDGGPMKMLTTTGERLLPGCQLRVGGRVLLFRLAAAPGS